MSLLDAAYEVLKKSGSPMSPADIIRQVLESGMWTTKGKTPEQTFWASVLRQVTATRNSLRPCGS